MEQISEQFENANVNLSRIIQQFLEWTDSRLLENSNICESQIGLAIEGCELCLSESFAFRKAFCQNLGKFYIDNENDDMARLNSALENLYDEVKENELVTSRMIEKYFLVD
jgi:hypothetical protein